jgi:tetratricopeptide (TPR) repeat protein
MKPTCALAAALAAVLAGAACGPSARPATPTPIGDMPPATDAPYELADDQDLASVRAGFEAMAASASGRAELRDRLADEYARRARLALDAGDEPAAFDAMSSLVTLWGPRELDDPAAATKLGAHRQLFEDVRRVYARAGGDREAVTAMFVLIAVDPERADELRAEIETVFRYADDLALAMYGAGSERSRPIEILELTIEAFPAREPVARLAELYVERQRAVHDQFRRSGANIGMVRAHGDGVLRTTWKIVRLFARAERVGDAAPYVARVDGLGDDSELRVRLEAAVAKGAPAEAWILLAAVFRSGDPDRQDPVAALRITLEAAGRFSRSAEVWAAAGESARALENTALAITLFEQALELDPKNRLAADNLSELYEMRLGDLIFRDRPRAARAALAEIEAFHAASARTWPEQPLSADLASAHASMGRGLVSLGELDEARRHLERSLAIRTSMGALEDLGTIALKQDRFREAIAFYERALTLPHPELHHRFARAKVLRLAGDAYAGAGQATKAERRYRDALAGWHELIAAVGMGNLRPRFQAEILIETGRLRWALGERDEGLDALDRAIDVDPDGDSTHAAVVAFLIVRDEYGRALDAYHRALGSHEIDDYFKVFMSLWVLAEARRAGLREDPHAVAYLESRSGRLWYDDLARFATGRVALDRLRARATTRGRRAELLYYAAVLSDAARDPKQVRRLMREVIATDMVLFFEYDMAKHWLVEGFEPAPQAAGRDR